MKILVIGEPRNYEECRAKFGTHDYVHVRSAAEADDLHAKQDVTFDFRVGGVTESLGMYADKPTPLFVNTCTATLAQLVRSTHSPLQASVFGFNGFPTLLNREVLEVSLLNPGDRTSLDKICRELNTAYLPVDDRVGMVTPRVVCMIINEAYYTVQEGTASREDIDLAMKLGTNYPFGPFEWCEKIGLKHVYELLEALYDDTKDERYKISALMKKEYLRR